ncbi:hypothetical protein ACFSC4_09820 [Deinococcus malanensis]
MAWVAKFMFGPSMERVICALPSDVRLVGAEETTALEMSATLRSFAYSTQQAVCRGRRNHPELVDSSHGQKRVQAVLNLADRCDPLVCFDWTRTTFLEAISALTTHAEHKPGLRLSTHLEALAQDVYQDSFDTPSYNFNHDMLTEAVERLRPYLPRPQTEEEDEQLRQALGDYRASLLKTAWDQVDVFG